jgi:transposase InsO family protein
MRPRPGPGAHPNDLSRRRRCKSQPQAGRQGGHHIEPGSPWQNPYVESFGGRLRDELLAVEVINALLETQVLVEDWRIESNAVRPHSALGYLTPTQ